MADGEASCESSTKKKVWHWNCISIFCKNSWRSDNLTYYTLTAIEKQPKKLREAYLNIIGKSEVNWKKSVICSAHWSKGDRVNLEDLPDIKYPKGKDAKPNVSSWHWNCAAALCTNSWRTKGVHYYKLSEIEKNKALKAAYSKIIKNANVNWQRNVICSEHWSNGFRSYIEDIPDKSTTKSYVLNKKSYITPPKKLEAAKRSLIEENLTVSPKKARRELIRASSNLTDPKDEIVESISTENSKLKAELLEVKNKLKERETELSRLSEELCDLKTDHDKVTRQMKMFKVEYERIKFSYSNVIKQGKCFYMTGLTETEFHCLFECIEPFTEALIFPDCKSSFKRKLDHKTELMCFLTICRHSLDLGVMGWMSNTSASTQSRLFVGWSVFLTTVMETIDLTPLPGEILAFLPTDFKEAGFGDTPCLGDCTETRIASSENFDINNITFSSYKNHTTGKTLVCITPHGTLLCCSDTYPGTITDTDITDQCGVLDMLERGTVVLTDKGFGITDLCLQKGLHHNHPPLKYAPQYDETDVSKNFDVATLRIYNENYIGRLRDWSILNDCWPSNRIDLLCYVFKVIAFIVNTLKMPICPKENNK